MRGLFIAALLAEGLLAATPAHAGLYNTEGEYLLDLVLGPPADYARALRTLQQVVAVELTDDPKSPRSQVLQRVKQLEQELRDGRLSAQGRINLSAYYVRLNQPEKAIDLLEAVPRHQRDFMTLSNLATAYQLTGNLERAEQYLAEALENWPRVSTETSSWRLNWLKVVERHHLLLIRGRKREQGQPGAAAKLDELFPGLRMVGPSREYEPGLLAAEQWARLPANYMEIVKLLVLWMPHDARLRWLLAEMVNANGDPGLAWEMMDELRQTRGFGNPEFMAHYRELSHAKAIGDHLSRMRRRFLEEKVKALSPLGGLLPPAPAVALDAAAAAVALDKIYQEPLPAPEMDVAPVDTAAAPPASTGWTPEWRQIAVSFVVGAVVATLLSLQLREIRRRKQDVQPASRE
jgi:tetratricopeptide (TPR) repeat protein